MKHVYKAIKQLRTQKGLTQAHMASKLGVTQNNYGKLERGLIQLTIERLAEIAKELETDPLQIMAMGLGAAAENYVQATPAGASETPTDTRQLEQDAKNLTLQLQTQTDRSKLLEEQRNFKGEQVQTLISFIKGIFNLIPATKDMEEPEEKAKIYLDFIYKINYTAERIFEKVK